MLFRSDLELVDVVFPRTSVVVCMIVIDPSATVKFATLVSVAAPASAEILSASVWIAE